MSTATRRIELSGLALALRHDQAGSRDVAYIPPEGLVIAANIALALGRPLLLTGEPGCGKTAFAHAAAHALKAQIEVCDVRSDSRARDLLYDYQALERFADAQVDKDRAKDARKYITLMGLGRALAPAAEPRPAPRGADGGTVVLIDEIDKAPRDLPNDLLAVLERGKFEIPEIRPDAGPGDLQRYMGKGQAAPLVVFTSNAEKDLPEPFLRRCIFFHIPFPGKKALVEILRAHFGAADPPDGPTWEEQAAAVVQIREIGDLKKRPSTAEMIDWARALVLRVVDREKVKAKLKSGSWGELPGLECLVKHSDDLAKLRRPSA
jgi:MoxR-like ATPase